MVLLVHVKGSNTFYLAKYVRHSHVEIYELAPEKSADLKTSD